MDFETLTKETLELTQNLNFDFEKFDDQFSKFNSEILADVSEQEVVDFSLGSQEEHSGTGIVYILEKGLSTFCLRGVASDDLSWEIEKLEEKDQDFLNLLRISKEEEQRVSEVRFFQTPNVSIAQNIVKTMMNRRYPIAEASLCNLSDPGFSWWMDQGETEINIYFQSHSIDRDKTLIQLGPLGDSAVAANMMQTASSTLKHFFPIKQYSVTSRSISISCCDNGIEGFSELARLFSEGEFHWEEILNMGTGTHHDVLEYLHLLSFKRRFWKIVSES